METKINIKFYLKWKFSNWNKKLKFNYELNHNLYNLNIKKIFLMIKKLYNKII